MSAHEPFVVAECAQCRGEVYAGEEVLRIDDGGASYVHNGYGFKCAIEYAKERVYDAEGTITKIGGIE